MTENSAPFTENSGGDDGPYSANSWKAFWQGMFNNGQESGSGVIPGSGAVGTEALLVSATSPVSAAVDVSQGFALVRGGVYESSATETLSIAANASGNNRIDTIILAHDYVAQEIRLAVKVGTPAGSPVPPALTTTAGVLWEIPLADVLAQNGFVSIAETDLTIRKHMAMAPGTICLDGVRNNSGSTLEDGDVVIWDSGSNRSVVKTSLIGDILKAGVWRGRTLDGAYGRVQVRGIGLVNVDGVAPTVGDGVETDSTPGVARTGSFDGHLGTVLDATLVGGTRVLCNIEVRRAENILEYSYEQPSGTAGGTSTGGSWQTYPMNTEASDVGGYGAVAANQVTVVAGKYRVDGTGSIRSPAATPTQARARIYNATDAAVIRQGVQGSEDGGDTSEYRATAAFEIAASKAIELQYYADNGQATDGLGEAMTTGENEVYGALNFVKIS